MPSPSLKLPCLPLALCPFQLFSWFVELSERVTLCVQLRILPLPYSCVAFGAENREVEGTAALVLHLDAGFFGHTLVFNFGDHLHHLLF